MRWSSSALVTPAHDPVVSLVDLNDLHRAGHQSTGLFRLKMNQKAEIIPEAFPNLKYSGFTSKLPEAMRKGHRTSQGKVEIRMSNCGRR